jgi:hypothetical protein
MGSQMNERIKELAEQATEHDYTTWDSYNQKELVYYKFNKEKFAELIVKECAGIYEKIDNGNLHLGTDNYLEALRKHFGM